MYVITCVVGSLVSGGGRGGGNAPQAHWGGGAEKAEQKNFKRKTLKKIIKISI